jgi:hypothetical protein
MVRDGGTYLGLIHVSSNYNGPNMKPICSITMETDGRSDLAMAIFRIRGPY